MERSHIPQIDPKWLGKSGKACDQPRPAQGLPGPSGPGDPVPGGADPKAKLVWGSDATVQKKSLALVRKRFAAPV